MLNIRLLFFAAIFVLLSGCAGLSGSDQSAQAPQARDTASTIDLTAPAHDIWDRIRRGFAIPNLQDDLAEHWTNYYASHPESVYRMSQRASRYLYFIVDELERRGMPTELALLPFVESAYNPSAYSKAKASGLWQFIPSTALSYNLQLDFWHDQRRDPVASTHAALDYLTYLYDFQGDWYLALASYNWGEGAVRRALDKIEGSDLPPEYLSLTLPDETRNYVPKLQAIKNIVSNPQKYGVNLPEVSNTPYFTTIKKAPPLEIEVAAQLAEMPIDEFKLLNAAFNQTVIHTEHEPSLLLPTDRVAVFNANLRAYQAELATWSTYETQEGESYADIAKKFGITLAQLQKINGLKNNDSGQAGRRLLIPTKPQGQQLAALDYPSNSPGLAQTQHAYLTANKRSQAQQQAATPATHTVKRGDTLYGLAKRYQTTVKQLRQLNQLKSDNLPLGKRLRLPTSSTRS